MNWRETIKGLPNFEPTALSLGDVGAWPRWARSAAMMVVCGFVLGASYPLFVAPARERLELAQLKEGELRRINRLKAAQTTGFAAEQANREALETAAASLFRLLPSGAEIPDLLDDITAAAEDNGLVMRSLDLKPERHAGFYAERPMEISVEGGYHEVGAFLSRVASLARVVTLHDFDLESAVAPGMETGVRLRVLAHTYRRLDDEDAAK